jgi:hypothetical protein
LAALSTLLAAATGLLLLLTGLLLPAALLLLAGLLLPATLLLAGFLPALLLLTGHRIRLIGILSHYVSPGVLQPALSTPCLHISFRDLRLAIDANCSDTYANDYSCYKI